MALALIILGVVLLDQLSKIWIRSSVDPYSTQPILEPILYLTYTKNPGAAFGILPDQKILFFIVTFLILSVLLFFYIISSKRSRSLTLSVALIMGGALGNFIDRALFGEVTDFIDVRFWPVFNFADIAVVVGFAIFSVVTIFSASEDNARKPARTKKPAMSDPSSSSDSSPTEKYSDDLSRNSSGDRASDISDGISRDISDSPIGGQSDSISSDHHSGDAGSSSSGGDGGGSD